MVDVPRAKTDEIDSSVLKGGEVHGGSAAFAFMHAMTGVVCTAGDKKFLVYWHAATPDTHARKGHVAFWLAPGCVGLLLVGFWLLLVCGFAVFFLVNGSA